MKLDADDRLDAPFASFQHWVREHEAYAHYVFDPPELRSAFDHISAAERIFNAAITRSLRVRRYGTHNSNSARLLFVTHKHLLRAIDHGSSLIGIADDTVKWTPTFIDPAAKGNDPAARAVRLVYTDQERGE
jgi:hypothetical protein